ncbi:MAG TPA: hypothetical protein VEZ17_18765 [Chitinophagaceae bacterium]|nr:hypothetical protein [Chitinophagaceae bacterium]
MKKILIINKFGPLSNAITGQNAKELADFLVKQQVEVQFICLQAEYISTKQAEKERPPYCVTELRNLYSGKSPLVRLLAGLLDGFRLWLTSLRYKCDTVIVMTDPPLLFFWFQLFRGFSKRKLCYWTMDLYPEAFVAGNYIRPGNPVYRFFHWVVYRKVPDLVIVLGKKQLEYLREKFRAPFPYVVIPCGIVERDPDMLAAQEGNGKIRFGYGGNIGEAHDAEFLISFIRELDPEKHEMVISLYGSKANYVKEVIRGNKNVKFKDFLNHSDLSNIDVNIATLLPRWHHICVPSKAVTAICCGSSLLLNTMPESDAWQMFKEGAWLIESGKDYRVETGKFLASINRSSISFKKKMAIELAEREIQHKKAAFDRVAGMI